MKVKSIAFCNTFDLHQAIISLENQFLVFLRVAVLHRFYWPLKNRQYKDLYDKRELNEGQKVLTSFKRQLILKTNWLSF